MLERISPQAVNALRLYDWPGNVRQLRNAIEHAIVMGEGKLLRMKYLPDYVLVAATVDQTADSTIQPTSNGEFVPATLNEIESRHIEAVLRECDGNKQRTATLLGISRSTLYEKMRNYGIE